MEFDTAAPTPPATESSADALRIAAPLAFSPLPHWLAGVAFDPTYQWAIAAWRRSAAFPGAWFDAAQADYVVANWPRWFKLTDDRFAGKSFRLLPWQEIAVRLLVGWKRPIEIIDADTGAPAIVQVRLFRRLDLWIPRKNGKSEFLAALFLLFFAIDATEGGQGFVFARDEKQALRVPFKKIVQMLRRMPGAEVDRKGHKRVGYFKKSVQITSFDGLIECLPGTEDGTHGRSPTVILGDEIHEWQTRGVSDNLRQGTGTRLQPMELYGSTTGDRNKRVGWEWFQESMEIMEGVREEPHTLVIFFGLAEDDDWTDERNWPKANPSIGLTPTWDYLRAEFRKARGKPAEEAKFQCFHLNRWVDTVSNWLPAKVWIRNQLAADDWRTAHERFAGRTCFGGIDISASKDITARALLFPPDKKHERFGLAYRFWIPEASFEARAERDKRVDWRAWRKIGAIELTAGDIVDQNDVMADLMALDKVYKLVSLGFDPFYALKLITDMQKDGFPAEKQVEVRQGARTLLEPIKLFTDLMHTGRTDHGGHPVMRWMVKNSVLVPVDRNMNMLPSKQKSFDKIDGVSATLNTLACFVAQPKVEESFWAKTKAA